MSLALIETTELGELAEFVRGINFKPDDVVSESTPGVVACMRTKNVQAELDQSDVWFVGRQFVKREEQMLSQGDILISSANSWNLVGKCCWIPELPWESTFGGFVTVLRAKRKKAFPRYLYHWFSSPHVQDFARSFGRQTTNISNLDLNRCLKMPVPLPPLSEQKRIAEILDQADALRAKRRAALALLDELTQSIFLDMFGDPVTNPKRWPTRSLLEVISMPLRNGLSPSKSGKVLANVLTLSAITGSGFNPTAVKESTFISTPPIGQSVNVSDFLICRGNGNLDLVGRGFFPRSSMPDTTFPDTMIAARIESGIKRPFLELVWNSRAVRTQIEASARTTNGTYKVNQTMLEAVAFFCPPIDSQRQFANRTTAIENLKLSQQASLNELDQLFASLQHRAFRGEL